VNFTKTTISTASVKKMNKEIIKTILKAIPSNTKASIAFTSGLSQGTCNTILNELVATGEVLVIDKESPNGGRPAQRFQYNGDYANILCFYIDNESNNPIIRYVISNLLGKIIEEKSISTDTMDYPTISDFIDQLMIDYNNIKAIGIGIPGVIHRHSVIGYCDVYALEDYPLAEKLQEKFGVEVTLENDMNLTAFGFYQEQNYKEDTSVAVLAFIKGNAPGAGLIVNGQIIRGYTSFAGEISYLPFDGTCELPEELLTKEETINSVVKSLCSIIAVINPETIMLTGSLLFEDMMDLIYQGCCKHIPKEHIPIIILRKSSHEYYLKGLVEMTLESISYPLKMVEKSF
jgi:predicted NBD/HSP70 family sugar kinase